jgi:CBS domain-containing protein
MACAQSNAGITTSVKSPLGADDVVKAQAITSARTSRCEFLERRSAMKAREIMTPDPETVTPEEPVSRAAQIMRTYDVGIVPVVSDPDSKNLIGVITDRDIAVRHVADSHMEDCTVGAHMTRDNIETAGETDDTATVMAAMKRREVRRIPVTNKNGKLVGVIAQADIAVSSEIPKDQVADVVKTVSEPAQPAR